MRKSSTPEYTAWKHMRARCTRKTHPSYADYGGRGITVWPAWQNYEHFLADVGPRPSADHSLDRIDNDKGYYPGNVRWATRAVQQQNRRVTRYTQKVVAELRELHQAGWPSNLLAQAMNENPGNMWRLLTGRTWKV